MSAGSQFPHGLDELAAALERMVRNFQPETCAMLRASSCCPAVAARVAPRPRDLDQHFEIAGELLSVSFDTAIQTIESDLLEAVWAASSGYALSSCCVPREELISHCWAAVGSPDPTSDGECVLATPGCTWEEVMYARIGETWRSRDPSLIWLDDKVAQVTLAAALVGDLGRPLHLPVLAHARTGENSEEEALREAARDRAARNEPFVVKPRHGANSAHIGVWHSPSEVAEADVLRSVDHALTGKDDSWNRECWQLSQVPRGALLQPLYAINICPNTPSARAAPIELKVQVLFGKVVGGTLNTHPQHLWVTRRGAIKVWDLAELRAQGHTRCRNLDKQYGQNLPGGVVEILQKTLRYEWHFIRHASELLTLKAGLDELRVDWLLGDERWGPRVGELTYMGAGSRLTRPLSARLARAYAAGHLCNSGLMVLVDASGSCSDSSDWAAASSEAPLLFPPLGVPLAPDPRRENSCRPPRADRRKGKPMTASSGGGAPV